MMRAFSAILLIGFFILYLNLARGQDDVPWPPDPREILNESVEIAGITSGRIAQEETRRSVADNENRVLEVHNAETDDWTLFSYPDELEQFGGSIFVAGCTVWGLRRLQQRTWARYESAPLTAAPGVTQP